MIHPPLFNGFPLKAFFTTKESGSAVGDISCACTVPVSRIYLPVQKHTDTVVVVEQDTSPATADAVVTDRTGILIGVQVADCVPLLLYEPERRVAAAVHAGWRGTAAKILVKTVQVMEEKFNADPSAILLAIGPSIRSCCYEVGDDVAGAVIASAGDGDYWTKKGVKYYLDLAAANRCQALSAGLSAAHIWTSGDCTRCLPEKYYSYRFAQGTTGRQGGFIGIV